MKTLRAHTLRTLQTKRLQTLGQRANQARRLSTSKRDAQRMRVWQADPRCASCGAVVPFEAFELDHIRPLSDGGTTGDENTNVMCTPCHALKTAQEVTQRARQRAGGWIYG